MRQGKEWTAIDRVSAIWKSDLTDKMKQFFPSSGRFDTAEWMLWAISNQSWGQHPTNQQLYGNISQKLSKLEEPDEGDTAREVGASS